MIKVFFKIILSFVMLNFQNSFSQLVSLTNLKQGQRKNQFELNFSQIIQENRKAYTFTDMCPLRIYGGTDAPLESVPYQISLRRAMMSGLYWFTGCGGSLITLKYVLTAAHCFVVPDFNKLKNNIRAVAGTAKTDATAYTMLSEHWRRIKHYFYHKKYDSNTFLHDIAVLEVESPFISSNKVQAIRMQSPHVEIKIHEGMMCLVTGYGYISKSKRPKKLQMVCVPLISRFNCSFYYSPKYTHPSTLCAGTKGLDSCQGDSGGPLVCQGVLVGIVSFGGECGEQPGVYTRISTYTSGELVPFIHKKGAGKGNFLVPLNEAVLACVFISVVITG